MCSAKKIPEGRTDFTGITLFVINFIKTTLLAMLHVPSLAE